MKSKMAIDTDKLNIWINNLNKREKKDLIKAGYQKDEVWTEEVIIPQFIYEKLNAEEKKSWQICKLEEIYTYDDVLSIFGVKPNKLNKCFSKKFYKLTKYELEQWEKLGQKMDTGYPIDDILIIYTQ